MKNPYKKHDYSQSAYVLAADLTAAYASLSVAAMGMVERPSKETAQLVRWTGAHINKISRELAARAKHR